MELRHLKYVVTVAEELHFGRAAARLNMSQPPLSQQIRQIEEELGVALFFRTKRHVQLTEAGRVFVEEARLTLAQADRTARRAVRAAHGEIGSLTVATVTSTACQFYDLLIDILRVFVTRYPNVRLELLRMGSAFQVQALREGRVHVGFVTSFKEDDELAMECIQREPLAIAVPKDHRFARMKTVTTKQAGEEPHILIPRPVNPGYYDMVLSMFREADTPLNVVHETDTIYTTLTLVTLGFGVAVLPASAQDTKKEEISFRRFSGSVPFVEHGVVYRRGMKSNVLDAFMKVVREVSRLQEDSISMAARLGGHA